MTWTARILLTLLTTLLAGPQFAPAVATTESVAPAADAVTLTATEAELVASSAALFEDAGLRLPDEFVASFHDDTAACSDNLGLSTIENGTPRIRVCWSHEDPGVEARLQQQALVHELAHAWADENLDDATRAAFVEISGADTWNRAASDWSERGTERAADLITWALLDPAVLFVDFADMSCHIWAPAFELLTGVEAPAPLEDAC